MVLLVEPNESARSVMQVALTRDGFEVIAVESAEEALRHLAHGPIPAAIVCESALPTLDGFAFCGQLRAEQSTAHVPVIILSRHAETYHPDMANGAGADDYLPKPLFARDVVSLVRLKTAPRALDGTIHAHTDGLPLPHLLRALLAGTRSGRIELSGGQAQVAFRQGRVIDASFGDFRGSDALMRVLLLAAGEYTVTLGPSLARATLSYGLRELVTAAFPRVLRWQSLVARGVPMDALLEVDFAQLSAALAELPDGVNDVVRLFDGRRTVRDVLIDCNLSEVLALEVITRLYSMGVVAPVDGTHADDEAQLARALPKLFEPAPREAHERMSELFGAEAPAPEQEGPAADDDWTDSTLFTDSFSQVEATEGWTAGHFQLPYADPRPEDLDGLTPEVVRQMDAFRIRPVVEPLDARPMPQELSSTELGLFLDGATVEDSGGSLAGTVQAMPEPIQLTEVVALAPIPLTHVVDEAPEVEWAPADRAEESFFSYVYGEAQPLAPARRKLSDVVGVVVVVGLLSAGVAAVAWRMGPSESASAAQVASAKVSTMAMAAAPLASPVAQVAPPAAVAAAPVAAAVVDAPTVEQGIALYDAGKAKEAAELLMAVVDAHPELAQAWLFLGLSRYDAGDRFGAEDAAMRTLDLDAKNGRAVMLLATIYLDAGQRQKAAVELKRYLALEPNGPFAPDARELLASF
jgi:CheY-like chemotaxis protein